MTRHVWAWTLPFEIAAQALMFAGALRRAYIAYGRTLNARACLRMRFSVLSQISWFHFDVAKPTR